MNVKAFEADQFAKKYYTRLINIRHAIDNGSPSKPRVPYSSRNTTHMTKYQQQLKTKKLINKLLEIHTSFIDDKHQNPKNKQKKSKSRRKLTMKSRKLSFSENKSFSLYKKSLVNPYKFQQKSNSINQQNLGMIDKLTDVKSDYSKQLVKQRQKKLLKYNDILKKSKRQEQIRDQYFDLFQYHRTTISRPTSSRKNTKKSRIMSATTRPQTAKQN